MLLISQGQAPAMDKRLCPGLLTGLILGTAPRVGAGLAHHEQSEFSLKLCQHTLRALNSCAHQERDKVPHLLTDS